MDVTVKGSTAVIPKIAEIARQEGWKLIVERGSYFTVAEMDEGQARLTLQRRLDALSAQAYPLKMAETVSVNGNYLWSLRIVAGHWQRYCQHGHKHFTRYLYHFFSLNYTIAHYNIHGWLDVYKTPAQILEMVFRGGELGLPPPTWLTDVLAIEQALFRRTEAMRQDANLKFLLGPATQVKRPAPSHSTQPAQLELI